MIDSKTKKVDRWIELPGVGYGSASTPDGKWLLIAMPNANGVAVVDLGSLRVVKTVDVPAAPQEVILGSDGTVAYVSCDRSSQVAAIQTGNWSVKLIAAGRGADGLALVK